MNYFKYYEDVQPQQRYEIVIYHLQDISIEKIRHLLLLCVTLCC